ncbi:MAG: Rrf2 family transcriptional regulator [Lachnospiraceae bacterium]|jgi:Rrf2 family protein|nr:Rrf2 family transcriptional regulator [Lachnospiraceae bacterium]
MLISTKGRYALRVMLEIASDTSGDYVPLAGIAEHQGISMKYLESIIVLLSKEGLLDGKRGKNGGYKLFRDPSEYTVLEILRLTEGGLAPVSCLEGEINNCVRAKSCQTLPIWEGLNNIINNYLGSITLKDLLEQSGNYGDNI